MKIIKEPTQTHESLINNKNPHISHTREGKFIIRVTQENKTYYYGSYDSLEEALQVEYLLSKKDFPTMYSASELNMKGKKYKDKLWSLLKK